jgi:hypothetical protein
MQRGERIMDSKIWRHIIVWCIATLLGYAMCVALYYIHQDMTITVWNKPFMFIMEKLILTIVGTSIMTGITIFIEVVSQIPVYTKLAEVPIAFAAYLVGMLYVIGWIWNGS